ncbi:MAG: class I SAM-dependent methyltransferase [candidate division WOR-3 bacterium]|nr:class I SAM-dependent methyltransferase [candidate division WOR-3 bacterium]
MLTEHNYSSQYYHHIEKGYYPFSFLRDKVIIHFIKKLVPRGKKILEVGCGTGRLLRQIENDYETYGVDISHYAITVAQSRTQSTLFQVASIEDNITLPHQFDGIVAINVLEHLENPQRALERIYQMLSWDGYLFLHLPIASNTLSRFLQRHFYYDNSHIFIPSLDELKNLLKKVNFSFIIERSGTTIFLPISSRIWVKSTPCYFGIYKKIFNKAERQ